MAYQESPPQPSAPPLDTTGVEASLKRQLSLASVDLINSEGFSSSMELTVSAKDLVKLDCFSKSDPVCILYTKEKDTNGRWVELDRTEIIKNESNPCFSKKFILQYKFEERQMLKFVVYDWDGQSSSLKEHDYLGEMKCALGEIVSSPNGKLSRLLQLSELCKKIICKPSTSSMTIVSEELSDCRKQLCLKVDCKLVSKSNSSIFGNCSPCLVISKQLDDGSWVLVHRTDRFDRQISLRLASLTSGGNLERPMKWQIFHKSKNSKWANAKFLGEFKTNYLHLLEHYQMRKGPLVLENNSIKNKKKQDTAISNCLEILSLSIEERISFLDHIKNGLELSITVAIDFTASNGDPSRHTSLHYRHGGIDNPYVMAIKTVGEIISDYSTNKRFAAFGFGSKGFPAGNRVSHNFPINLKLTDPYCDGIEGVLSAYSRVLKRIKLSGPTYFTPIIQEQARIARENSDGKTYYVLLILTDGIICDPVSTQDNIVKAASLPMSIIIIGVGDEDFKEMEKLDCDGGFLKSSNGQFASRDIVQFVELKKYINFKSICPINDTTKAALTSVILAELPSQICEWMAQFVK